MLHGLIGLLLCCIWEPVADLQSLCCSVSIRTLIEVATGSVVKTGPKVFSYVRSEQDESLQKTWKMLQKPFFGSSVSHFSTSYVTYKQNLQVPTFCFLVVMTSWGHFTGHMEDFLQAAGMLAEYFLSVLVGSVDNHVASTAYFHCAI
jgi:hypothetical protein